jgi:hypothetical protein
MHGDKRYQVFLSSTYTDLKQERSAVIRALMQMDCIPAGMEIFPASDDEQFEFIKKVIDDCDYYILIIGGRYGSLTAQGVSFTEREFDYAGSKGIPVLAFVHEAPEEIALGKSDLEPELRIKLEAFRSRICQARLVKMWRSPAELTSEVVLSLNQTMKAYPAIGWVRANTVATSAILADMNEVRKENAELTAKVAQLEAEIPPPELASLDDLFEIQLAWKEDAHRYTRSRKETVKPTWNQIFAAISPDLEENPNDGLVKIKLAKALHKRYFGGGDHAKSIEIDADQYKTIRVQLKALGLINTAYLQSTIGTMNLFWSLTELGAQTMVHLRTVKAEVT